MPKATCSCGLLSLDTQGAPTRVSACHCYACQRRTGSAFGVQARYAREHVVVSGPSTAWTRTGDSGGVITFHFCPTCGSTVYWEIDAVPGFLALAVGAFADRDFGPPTVSVYEARAHDWVDLHVEEKWD